MKKLNYTLLSIVALTLLGCSSLKKHDFTYFSQQADFNIAQIILDKISIIGVIDDSHSLSAQQQQQLTQNIFYTFAQQVDEENLINTEQLARQIGISNYQRLKQFALTENIEQLAEIANQLNTTRYLLIIRLTNNTDHGEQQKINGFLDDCSYYGRSVGLTMKIIDRKNAAEIWGGHLNKSSKTNSCTNNLTNNNTENQREALAWLVTLLVVSAIADNDSSNNNTGGFDPIFNEVINEFAQKLPSFYH